MPYIDTSGRGHHRFRLGDGLYTQAGNNKGPNPTPSQKRHHTDATDIDLQWFHLTRAQKKLWNEASREIRWNDLGQAARQPTGRQLFNRLNRSRHGFYTFAGRKPLGTTLPTLAEPPGAPVQVGAVAGFSITTRTPMVSTVFDPNSTFLDPRGILEYAWLQMCTLDTAKKLRSLNSQDDPGITGPNIGLYSEKHPCDARRLDLAQVAPGQPVDLATLTPGQPSDSSFRLEMQAQGWFPIEFTPDALYPPPGQPGIVGFWTKPLRTNTIDNYDPYDGYAGLLATPPPGAGIFLQMLWNPAGPTFAAKGDRWRWIATLPPDLHQVATRTDPSGEDGPGHVDGGVYLSGGSIMPDITTGPDLNWQPGPGLSDWTFTALLFNNLGIAGASLKFRYWPFTMDGWPGSIQEFNTVAGGPPTYDPLPSCPLPRSDANP